MTHFHQFIDQDDLPVSHLFLLSLAADYSTQTLLDTNCNAHDYLMKIIKNANLCQLLVFSNSQSSSRDITYLSVPISQEKSSSRTDMPLFVY